MRRFGWVLMTAAMAVLCVGCGSGGGSPAAATSPGGAAAESLTPREKSQQAMRRYMAQSRIANGYYQRARSQVNRTLEGVVGAENGDPRLPEAGRELKEAGALASEAAVRQRLAQAPRPLRGINRRFATDMGRASDYWDEIGGALLSDDPVGSYRQIAAQRGGLSGEVRSEWRITVTAELRRLGLELPSWAQIIGTSVP